MAHPLPLPPICLGNHPERAPPSQSKPNLRALASKKGRSICRRQNLVRERAPGSHMGKGLSGRKAGQQMGTGVKRRRAGEAGEVAPKNPQAGHQG